MTNIYNYKGNNTPPKSLLGRWLFTSSVMLLLLFAGAVNAASITSTTTGGLWSSTLTWVGSVVPVSGDKVTIADGATVTVDASGITLRNLTVGQGASGILQWNATANAITVSGNILINSGASFLPYTTGSTGVTINLGGNFANNGFTNLALSGSTLNFNGSLQSGGATTQSLSGTGTFVGDGTNGIIRNLLFQTTGACSISTSTNLTVTEAFTIAGGSLATNNKLSINNTAQVFGQTYNQQVANVVVTGMGTASIAPVAFGTTVVKYVSGASTTLGLYYFNGSNVYLCTSAAAFTSTPPTHNSPGAINSLSGPELLWVGTIGTIGTPFTSNTGSTAGTLYFYGNNLYLCTVSGTGLKTSPPVHPAGEVLSGATAKFLFVGAAAKVTVNWASTFTRTLTLTNTGSGYLSSTAPTIAFSQNGGTGTLPSASAVIIQSIQGQTAATTVRSSATSITGTITIKSDQTVGNIVTTNGGNYSVAPLVGFTVPTGFLNLVTAGGSGYTTVPTVTVTGGTVINSFSTPTLPTFTVVIAQGKVISVICTSAGTSLYTALPTLTITGGGGTLATAAFPATCLPTATATLNANGAISGFNITNAGSGYPAAPVMGFGTAAASGGNNGTFTFAATAPSCRVGLYNLSYTLTSPTIAGTNVVYAESAEIPTNRRINAFSMNSSLGANFTGNLELYSASPLTLSNGKADFGANTVTFSHPAYNGASGSTTASLAGTITLTHPGGSATKNFPFDATVAIVTGSGGDGVLGCTFTSLTVSRIAAATGTITGSAGAPIGTRSYSVSSNGAFGFQPTLTLNWNANDALSATQQLSSIFVGQSLTGPTGGTWTIRSLTTGVGLVGVTTGSRATNAVLMTPINLTNGAYFSFVSPTTGTSTSTAIGGLWSDPNTWATGIVPTNQTDAVIANGAIVTIDVPIDVKSLTVGQGVSGILQWNGTANAATVSGNISVSAGANFLPYTTGSTGVTLNIGGDFINAGTVNAALASTLFNFNGSQQIGGSASQNLTNTGTFIGTGSANTNGIIRSLFFQSVGTLTLSSTQPLVTTSLANTAGTLNTGGVLTIDNTVQVYGQALNRRVASIAVTTMGVAYSAQPVVFGAAVTPYANALVATTASFYFNGSNVYYCTVGAAFNATPPTSTGTTTFTSSGPTLMYVGTLGTLGSPFVTTSLTAGNQVFYNGNLYTVTATASNATPPTHVSGITGNFAYVGPAAQATLNYNAIMQNVRSLTLTNAGVGYLAAPTAVISVGVAGGTVVTPAVAAAVFIQQVAGPANSLTQKSGIANMSGALAIKSDQAVGGISTTNGGTGYTVAPLVGFPVPTGFLNLLTISGSGYTASATAAASGGTIINSSITPTAPTFTVVTSQGKVVSVICTSAGTALYTTLPTITISGANTVAATAAFPAGCLPTATAVLANQQIVDFTITAPGFGYPAAPTPGYGTAANAGTFTGGIAAVAPTCRIGLYNITYAYFTPATSNVTGTSGTEIPTNRRVNAITMSGLSGQTLTGGDLELYSLTPITLTSGALNTGANTVVFSHPSYAGVVPPTSGFSYINGNASISSPGGSLTRTIPVGGGIAINTGTGSLLTGSTITRLTAKNLTAPTGTGNPIGARSYSVNANGGVYGVDPRVTLNYNFLDQLANIDAPSLFVSQSAAQAGPWTTRSVTNAAAALTSLLASGSRQTGTTATPPVIVPTAGDDFYAWSGTFTPPAPLDFVVTRTTGNTYQSIASVVNGGDGTGLSGASLGDEGTLTVPFTGFSYQGSPVTAFVVQGNGIITLKNGLYSGSPVSCWDNTFAVSTGGTPDINKRNVITPFYEDLNSGGTNPHLTYYKVVGNKATIEFYNSTIFGLGGPQLYFQMVLDGADNSITFNYGDVQTFNGTQNVRWAYSCGMSGAFVDVIPTAGQVFQQQYENTTFFSHENSAIQNWGANGLAIAPEPRSSIRFVPGTYVPVAAPLTTPPVNDEAINAVTRPALLAFPTNIAYDVATATSNVFTTRYATTSTQAKCDGLTAAKDVWFKFVANNPTMSVRIYASGGFIPRLEILDGTLSPLAPVQCLVGTQGLTVTSDLVGLTPGNTYYARVYHNQTGVQATGTVSIANGSVTGLVITTNGTNYTDPTPAFGYVQVNRNARVTFNGGGGRGACGGITSVLTNGIINTASIGLFPGIGYTSAPTVTIESPDWGVTGEFGIIIFAKASNDECLTAKDLTNAGNGTCTTGQNQILGETSAAATPSAEIACTGTADDDVWYKFTGTGYNIVTVKGNGTYDPAFQIWDGGAAPGDCGGKVPEACVNANSTAGGTETRGFATTIGNVYFVRVYHAPAGAGGLSTFDICVTSSRPLCIASPVAPLSGASTCNGTSITLSWAAATAATGYDVYLTAGLSGASTLVSSNQVGLTYTTSGSLTPGNYSWRVVPRNDFGAATGTCNTWTFSTIDPVVSTTTGGSRCGAGQVVLLASAPAGSTLNWYDVSTGGIAAGTGPLFTTGTISTNTNYYVASKLGTCESARTTVLASVTPAPALTLSSNIIECATVIDPLAVTTPSGNFNTYIWSPITNLYQDAAGLIQYTGQSLATVYVRTATGGTTTYTCTASDFTSLCSNVATVNVTRQPSTLTITSAPTSVCVSGSAVLTLASASIPATGTIHWQVSSDGGLTYADIVPAATAATYTTPSISATAYYKAEVRDGSIANNICSSALFTLVVNNPQVLTTIPGTRCGTGTVVLGATGDPLGSFSWYAASTGGSSLGSSASFTAGPISTTTPFYVAFALNGCTGTRTSVTATVTNTQPAFTIATNLATVCNNGVATLSVTSPSGNYDVNVWTPIANLYTDLACTIPYTTGINLSTVYAKTTTAGSVTYTCNASNSSSTQACANSATVAVSTLPASATVSSSPSAICNPGGSGSATLSLNPLTPYPSGSIQWQYFDGLTFVDVASGGNSATYATGVISATTQYQAIIKNSAGTQCTIAGPYTLQVNTQLAITASSAQAVCNGEIATLAVTSLSTNYDSYIWSPTTGLFTDVAATVPYTGGSATTVYALNATVGNTTYTVNGTTVTGCSASATSVVTRLPLAPTISASPTSICVSGTSVLSLSNASAYTGATIQWQYFDGSSFVNVPSGGNGVTYTTDVISLATQYQATITNSASVLCATAGPITINVNTPSVSSPINGALCGSGSVTVGATPSAGSLKWYTALTGGSSFFTGSSYTTPTLSATTIYYVSDEIGSCASTPRTAITVTYSASPNALTLTAAQTVCNTEVATVAVTSSTLDYTSFVWSPTAGLFTDAAATIAYTGGSATTLYALNATVGNTTYTVNATNSASPFCSATATTVITRLPSSVAISATTNPICGASGSSTLTLATVAGFTYTGSQWESSPDNSVWTPVGASNATSLATGTISQTMYYRTSIKNSLSVTCLTPTITIDVFNPSIASTTPASRCGDGPITISALATVTIPASTYKWYAASSGGSSLATSASYAIANITSTTTYYVAAVIGTCESARVPVIATVTTNPSLNVSASQVLCGTAVATISVTSTAANFSSYIWSPTTGLFTDALATIAYTGTSATTVYATGSGTVNYTVSATNGGGCSRTAIATVIFQPTTANILSSQSSLCQSGSSVLSLDATFQTNTIQWQVSTDGGLNYSNILGETNATYSTGTISATTLYKAVIKNGAGVTCFTTGAYTLIVNNPQPSGVTNNSRCGTGDVVLGAATGSGTINWYTAATGGTSIQLGGSYTALNISSTTTYYVGVTDAGCEGARVPVVATIVPPPTLTLTGSKVLCNGVIQQIDASAGYDSYFWSPFTNLYSDAAATIPILAATTYQTVYYKGTTTTFGEVIYTCSATSVAGCSATAQTSMTNQPTLLNTLSSTPSSLCISGSSVISLSNTNLASYGIGTIEWHRSFDNVTFTTIPGEIGPTYITLPQASTRWYYAVVNSSYGVCLTSDVYALQIATPTVATTTPATLCGTGPFTISATGTGILNWYTAASGGTPIYPVLTGSLSHSGTASTTTSYYVESNIGATCLSGRTQVLVTVTPPPTLTLTASQTICNGDITPLSVTVGAPSYASTVWSPVTNLYTDAAATIAYTGTSATTVYLKRTAAGTVTYTVTGSGSGCNNTATTTVTVNPGAFTITASPASICISGSTVLTIAPIAGFSLSTVQWQDSPDNITFTNIIGATGATYTSPTLTAGRYYKAILLNSASVVCPITNSSISISVNNPSVTANVPATRCGVGTVTLDATPSAGATIYWFNVPSGGASVATGNSYTTPVISTTTNYYAQAVVGSALTSATVGTGTVNNTTTSYPTPYGQFYGSSHDQYMILASELQAQGYSAGAISSMSFTLASAYGGTALSNYVINMGQTAQANMATFISTGFTNVYTSPGAFSPTVGLNTYAFSTPFNWDGTSNLVVDLSFSNCSVCNGTSSCTTAFTTNGIVNQSTTSFVSSYNVHADGNCTINSFAPSGGIVVTASQRPNMTFDITQGCLSARTQVTATVTAPPALSASANQSVCNNSIATISAIPVLSTDFDTYLWSPTTDLYADAAATVPYTNQNQDVVYVKSATVGTRTYTVLATYTPTLCSNIATTSVTTYPAALVATNYPSSICVSGNSLITLQPIPGFTYGPILWETSPDGITYTAIAGETGTSYTTPTISVSTYYRATIFNGATPCVSVVDLILVTNPGILSTAGATRCGTGSVTLTATPAPGSTLSWYTAATGGSPITGPYSNVPVTGFNNDIVANGVGTNSINGTTYSFGPDGAGYTFIDYTFKYTAANALPSCYMPIGNLAPSLLKPGLTYQFQSYTANNALSISNSSTAYTNPIPSSGTLTLATPAAFGNLVVLYESVVNVGSLSVDATVTFTDASTQVIAGNSCANWFTASSPAFSGMGRTTPGGVIQCGATPNMFELNLPISPANQAKLVQSISFSIPTVLTTGAFPYSVNYFHAMAVGGNGPAPANSYTTPTISTTTTYYVGATAGVTVANVGVTAPPSYYSATTGTYGITFNATKAFTINTVDLYPSATVDGTPGTVTIALQDAAGTTITTRTVNVIGYVTPLTTSAKNTVTLNIDVPAGTGYRLTRISTTGISALQYDCGSAGNCTTDFYSGAYPTSIAGVMTQVGGHLGSTTTYNYYINYFYNWTVFVGCESGRTPVVATITAPPAITVTGAGTYCNGQTAPLNVTSPNDPDYTYVWNAVYPGASYPVTPSTTTTYTLVATDNTAGPNAGCVNTTTALVTVNPVPTTPIISPASTAVCVGATVNLIVTNPVTSAQADRQIGNGVATGNVSGITPYDGLWEGAKKQYLYTAAELTAAGLVAGNINAIKISTTSSLSVPLTNYSIKIGATAATDLNTAYVTTGLIPVYTSPNYTVATGVNTHTFSAPFAWNGTSNIVVDICFDNDPAGTCVGGSGVCYTTGAVTTVTTTAFVSTRGNYGDNSGGLRDMCNGTFGTSVTGGTSRPNITFTGETASASPATYLWNPGAVAGITNTVTPASTTTYTVVGTNTFGCTSQSSSTITVNALPTPVLNYATDQTVCNTDELFFTVGDAGAYSGGFPVGTLIDWNGVLLNVPPSTPISSLGFNTFYATVKVPGVGCTVTSASTNVTVLTVSASTTTTPSSCSGGGGSITTTATGVGPFRYLYTADAGGLTVLRDVTSASSTDTYTGLATGTYYVTVTGNYGAGNNPLVPSCSSVQLLVAVGGTTIFNLSSSSVAETCPGANNGSATALPTGGSGNFSYDWDLPSGHVFTQSIGPIAPGTYGVTVTDNVSLCSTTILVTINAAIPATYTLTNTPATCYGANDGYLSADFTGSAVPILGYEWLDAPGGNILGADAPFTGAAGSYYLHYYEDNANQCEITFGPIVITQPAAITVTGFTPTNAAIGATVVITGTNFTGASAVTFNGTAAVTYTVNSSTQITATVPVGATTGLISVYVGTCLGTSTGTFTVNIPTFATLNLKTFLSGYYIGGGLMNATLFNTGMTTVATDCDYITVELRDPLSTSTAMYSQTVILNDDGTTMVNFPAAAAIDPYFIAVMHRNCITTYSDQPYVIGSSFTFDFTTAKSKAFGDNQLEVETGVFGIYNGDISDGVTNGVQDGVVDGADYSYLENQLPLFIFGFDQTDLNGDGTVDGGDYSLLENYLTYFIFVAQP